MKIYRVVLRGGRKGDGFFTIRHRATAESVRKNAEKIHGVPCEVIPEPNMTEEEAVRLNGLYINLKFYFI